MGGKAYIGTSGWSYRAWRGRFYPQEIPQRRWLDHLAHTLDSVEVNGTFYKFPTKDVVKQWADEVPRGFRLALKMWRGVSHYKKLKDPDPKLRDYLGHAAVIPTAKRGPILTQMPPNQGKDLDKLDHYLERMKKVAGKQHWRRAVEFRNAEWYDDDTYRMLDRHRTALCLHDMKGAGDIDEPNDASFLYVRRHGPGGNTQRGYSKKQIRQDARRIEAWMDAGKTVFVYYNNDGYAHAPKDACALKEALAA